MLSRKSLTFFILGVLAGYTVYIQVLYTPLEQTHQYPRQAEYSITPEIIITSYKDLAIKLQFEKMSWPFYLTHIKFNLSFYNPQEQVKWIDLTIDYIELQFHQNNVSAFSWRKVGLDYYEGNPKVFLAPKGNNCKTFIWTGLIDGSFLPVGIYDVKTLVVIDGIEHVFDSFRLEVFHPEVILV